MLFQKFLLNFPLMIAPSSSWCCVFRFVETDCSMIAELQLEKKKKTNTEDIYLERQTRSSVTHQNIGVEMNLGIPNSKFPLFLFILHRTLSCLHIAQKDVLPIKWNWCDHSSGTPCPHLFLFQIAELTNKEFTRCFLMYTHPHGGHCQIQNTLHTHPHTLRNEATIETIPLSHSQNGPWLTRTDT